MTELKVWAEMGTLSSLSRDLMQDGIAPGQNLHLLYDSSQNIVPFSGPKEGAERA